MRQQEAVIRQYDRREDDAMRMQGLHVLPVCILLSVIVQATD